MKRALIFAMSLFAILVWTVPSMAAVEFSGQYRLRAEMRTEDDLTDGNDTVYDNNDNIAFYGQRVRLSAVSRPTEDTEIKLTIQDTRNWGAGENAGGGPALTDAGGNTIDLHESYLLIKNFFGTPVNVKMGRQELVYGDERLIGNFNWSNNGRSFDALKFIYSNPTVDVDFWISKIGEGNATAGNNDDLDFYGLYATVKSIQNNTLDLYLLNLREHTGSFFGTGAPFDVDGDGDLDGIDNALFAAAVNTVDLWTLGARLKGSVPGVGIDYTLEVPYQFGEMNTNSGTDSVDIKALAYAIKLGWAIPSAPYGLKVGIEYDHADGTDEDSDDWETFSNLFPTNHDKLGYMDLQAWRNVDAWNLNVQLPKLTSKLGARLDYWDFTLDEEADRWYGAANWNSAPTTTVRSGCTDCDDHMGSEVDLTFNYQYNSAVALMFGYSHFFAGAGIDDRVEAVDPDASGEDQDWAYVMVTANFN